ncbi:MAG: PIN domain-containing protein [Thermomicrobiales bacterium]
MTRLDSVCATAAQLGVPVALDSSALIAFLTDEQPLGPLVAKFTSNKVRLVLSAIVISESIVRTARFVERSFLDSVALSLQADPNFLVIPFGAEQIVETALVRVETRLKFPDAAIIATARLAGAIAIVGNDRAWQNKPLGIQYIHLDDVAREQQQEEMH